MVSLKFQLVSLSPLSLSNSLKFSASFFCFFYFSIFLIILFLFLISSSILSLHSFFFFFFFFLCFFLYIFLHASLIFSSLVYPSAKCKLRLMKLERIKDYILMEQEFIQNQELRRPSEEQNSVSFSAFLSLLPSLKLYLLFSLKLQRSTTSVTLLWSLVP